MSAIQSKTGADQLSATNQTSKANEIFEKLNGQNKKHGSEFASMLSGWRQGAFQGGDRLCKSRLQMLQTKMGNSSVFVSNADAKRQKEIETEEAREEEEKKELEQKRLDQKLALQEEIRQEELQQEEVSKMAVNLLTPVQTNSPFANLVASLSSQGASSGASTSGNAGGNAGSGNQAASTTILTASTATNTQVNGYAVADPSSQGAQAAASMAQISDESVNIEQDLNQINQSNLSNTKSANRELTLAERIAVMDNNELRQSLDELAKAGSVSKLRMNIANPQTQAQAQANAAAISNLPTSGNKLAGLTASAAANSAPAAGATSGPTGTVTAKGATNQVSTESVIKYRQTQQSLNPGVTDTTNTKSQELLQMTASPQADANKQALAKASHAAGSVSGATNNSRLAMASHMTNVGNTANVANGTGASATVNGMNASSVGNGTTANVSGSESNIFAQMASGTRVGSVLNATNTINTANAGNVGSTFTHGLGASGTALLASVAASGTANVSGLSASSLVSGTLGLGSQINAAEESALASLANTTSQNSAVKQALESLKQGMGIQQAYTQGYDPRAYAGNLNVADANTDTNSEGDANNLLNEEQATASTSASAAVSSSATAASAFAQALNQQNSDASASLVASMPLSSSAAENAKELHDKVMQMAARNLKQLSVDLSPNNLGKMRIEIALDKDNDALSVSLSAAHPQTRAALEEALPQLKETLAQLNIMADEHVYVMEDPAAQQQSEAKLTSANLMSGSANTTEEFLAQRGVI